ncbi:MAG: tRNA-dihydrouridine synthase, partial [Pseudomonadota bacterium]
NAEVAVSHGSPGIDLNFGCPAKTVNRHKGGAVLLKEPETLHAIIKAVREAVPSHLPVCAKIRLGYEDKVLALENADAICSAGADLLTVHARTKTDGYKPPAYWDWIAKIKQVVNIPVIANGEIWHAQDAMRCKAQSETQHIMLGRGALSLPNLAATIVNNAEPMKWDGVKQLLIDYSGVEVFGNKGKYYPNRVKQWLTYLKREYKEADTLFMQIRRLQDADDIVRHIQH